MTNCKTPCPECAFRRDIPPGHLGGSSPDVYIGQIHGPFIIPCHLHYPKDAKSMNDVRGKAFEIPQCAGAAVFRANMGIDSHLPQEVHRLPADHETVFSNYAEFLAHHARVSHYQAVCMLMVTSPTKLLERELSKTTVIHKKVEK